jgi:phosphatidylinositol alpha-1,6-mannosyltransferase
MTTLLITDIFPPKTGGSGRWFWEIYRRLPRADYLIAAGEDPRQEELDGAHDLRVVRLPLCLPACGLLSVAGLRGYRRALARLLPLVRAEQVRQVHCGRCLPEGVMALALRWLVGTPYLCYIHGEDVTTAATSRELRWLVQRVLRGARRLIANSHNTARILREEWHIPDERVRLLHPGVDTKRFVPVAPNAAVRTRFGWGTRPVLLTVGRLQKRKGHDQMIRALTSVRKSFPDVLYAIIGDGEDRPALERLVAHESLGGHVQFFGEVDDADLVRAYQQCDLFVLPNRQVGADIEGFGMVLLEAQACGKPVVAGASGGTAETMRIPQTGRVVSCDAPDALADLVIELLSDRARLEQMGAQGRAWVVEHFDWAPLSRQANVIFRGESAAAAPARESRSTEHFVPSP